jgi:carbon storage regulator CsrA
MLVLTQKEGEVLQVGPDVRIYIKRIKGNWVRLCIDAPREVQLQRIPAHEVVEPPGVERANRDRRDADDVTETDAGTEPARR